MFWAATTLFVVVAQDTVHGLTEPKKARNRHKHDKKHQPHQKQVGPSAVPFAGSFVSFPYPPSNFTDFAERLRQTNKF